MADEVISVSELLEMVDDGAILRRESKPTVIERFDELIAQLKALVESQKELAAADLARSKTQLEVLATLQANIKKANTPKVHPAPDLKPLMLVLAEIQKSNHHEPHDYDFNILRSGPGLSPAVKIEARVVRPTQH